MSKRLDINKIFVVEAAVWFCILSIVLFGVKSHNVKVHKAQKQYQMFISDVDGLIIGSPVKYMGVQIGYVSYAKLLTNEVYVKFVLTQPDIVLPKGVVANVEFNGLGGTKSLELYPPTEQDLKTEKIINIKDTFRLAHSVDLLDNMMSKLAQIGGKFTYFMKQMTPYMEADQYDNLVKFNDNLEHTHKNFKKLSSSRGVKHE